MQDTNKNIEQNLSNPATPLDPASSDPSKHKAPEPHKKVQDNLENPATHVPVPGFVNNPSYPLTQDVPPTDHHETFTINVPEEDHERLAVAIEQNCKDHASLHPNRRSLHARNSDETVINAKVLHDDVIQITVTDNPKKISISELKEKAEKRVKELLGGEIAAGG